MYADHSRCSRPVSGPKARRRVTAPVTDRRRAEECRSTTPQRCTMLPLGP
jgi:hypothetical protein